MLNENSGASVAGPLVTEGLSDQNLIKRTEGEMVGCCSMWFLRLSDTSIGWGALGRWGRLPLLASQSGVPVAVIVVGGHSGVSGHRWMQELTPRVCVYVCVCVCVLCS